MTYAYRPRLRRLRGDETLYICTFGTTSVLYLARSELEAFNWLTGRGGYGIGEFAGGRLRKYDLRPEDVSIRPASAADGGWVDDAGNARAKKVFAKAFPADDLAVAA